MGASIILMLAAARGATRDGPENPSENEWRARDIASGRDEFAEVSEVRPSLNFPMRVRG